MFKYIGSHPTKNKFTKFIKAFDLSPLKSSFLFNFENKKDRGTILGGVCSFFIWGFIFFFTVIEA